MGKATINSHIAGGQYSVTTKPDNSCINSEIARLQLREPEIEADITAKETEIEGLETATATARAALDVAITEYAAGTKTQEDVIAAESALNKAVLTEEAGKRELAGLRLELAALKAEISRLQSISLDDQTVSMWCADLTEDLSGDVGTMEINGNAKNGVQIIQPGFEGNAVYSLSRDGVVVSPEAVGQATNYLFWCLNPCVNKWKPTYRVGTITSVDEGADTVNVTLDDATGPQGIGLNFTNSLTNVSVTYQDCNASAFEAGDRCVVKFEGSPSTPTVIGFESEPKSCAVWSLNGMVRRTDNVVLGNLGHACEGIFKALKDRPVEDATKFRLTIDGNSIPLDYTLDSRPTVWELGFYLDQSSGGWTRYTEAYITRGDAYTCEGETMVLVGRHSQDGGLSSTMTVLLEEDKGGAIGWVPVIDCTIATNPILGSHTSPWGTCQDTQYDGSDWTFTQQNDTKIEVRDPDVVTFIVVN